MKLLIQHRHHDHEISGVLTYIFSIIAELETRGIEVRTISTKQDSFIKWLQQIIWADIIHMNSNDLLFALTCKIFRKKIIIKYHYPFYQSTHTKYEIMSFIQRLKAEFKRTLPKAEYPLKWKLYTVVKWLRLATRLATSLLVNYHTACSNFLAESCAFPWKVDTLYNPIDIPQTNQPKNLEDLSQPYKFVFVGRLAEDKGVDILLQAVKLVQDEKKEFQVLIIGDGSQASKFKQLAADLDILDNVSFLGKLPNQEALVKVQDALALVTPSRWQDPAPYVVLEASSVQTCSIVSNMGGLPEVAGPNSLMFPNEDFQELANCMRYCLDNPEAALKRGLQSSQYVSENFSPALTTSQLLEICHQLIPKVLPTDTNSQIKSRQSALG